VVSRTRRAPRIVSAVLVAASAATAGLAAGTTPTRHAAAPCSITEVADDPAMARDGYVQASYLASCPGAVTTGITLGLYHYPHQTARGVLIAQTGCTTAGTSIECRISAPCLSGPWDVTVGTNAAWPPGTAPPDFGWNPAGRNWSIAACPAFVPGVQSLVFGGLS
jgi:hypothetical protein